MDFAEYKARLLHVSAGLGMPVPDGRGVDQFWPFLERMRQEGAVAIVKLDGERRSPDDTGPYTSVVSGGRIGERHFRTDANSVEDALAYIVVRYFSDDEAGALQ